MPSVVLEAGCEKAQCSVIDMGSKEEGAEGFCETMTSQLIYIIAKIKSRQMPSYWSFQYNTA